MKMRFLCLIIAAMILFPASSSWEGAAAVAPAGEIPETGRYVATNSFPPHTIVEIRNIENSRSTHAIVVKGLNSPGLLALVSREVAQILGMRAGSISRVRMLQPSDPMAYLRFTESLSSDFNLNTIDNYVSEEELLARLYSDDRYVPPPPAQNTQVPNTSSTVPLIPPAVPNSVIERGYVVNEPEWGGTGRLSIIDIPQFEVDPVLPFTEHEIAQADPVLPFTEHEIAQVDPVLPFTEHEIAQAEPQTPPARAEVVPAAEPIVQEPTPVAEPAIVQQPAPAIEPAVTQIPEPVVDENLPVVKNDPVYVTQNDRDEVIKNIPQRYEETSSAEIVKEIPFYNPEDSLKSINKDTPVYITEQPRALNDVNKDIPLFLTEQPRDLNDVDKDIPPYITEQPQDEIIKDIADRVDYYFEDEYTVAEKPVEDRPFITEPSVPVIPGQPIQPGTSYTLVQTNEQSPPSTIYGIDPNALIPGISMPPAIPSVVAVQPAVIPSTPSAVREQLFSVQTISRLDNGQYYVQLAALPENLVENTIRLIDRRYNPVVFRDSDNLYRVLIGPLNHGESAAVLQRFRTIGFRDAFVRRGV